MSSIDTDSIGLELLPAVLILVVGIGVAGYGGYSYVQQSDAIANTVEVDATITETDVRTVQQRRSRSFVPEVTFEYRYQGASYTSSNVFPAGSAPRFNNRANAEDVLDNYGTGTTVTAYVNPDSPDSAFLENRRSNRPVRLAAIGGIVALAAAGHLVRTTVLDEG